MQWTVRHANGFHDRREFDAYVRLLQQRGIDWSDSPRVSEPGPEKRWLFVWGDRTAAEQFCEALRTETADPSWQVDPLESEVQTVRGSLVRVVILMRRQSPSSDFSLHPHSRLLIRRRYPEARPVSSISVEWTTQQDFESEHGSIWDHIAMVLTGLSLEQLESIEGYQIYDLFAETVVFDSLNVEAVSRD